MRDYINNYNTKMAKRNIETILEVLKNLETKQKVADELSALITKIQESTDPDGNIEISLTRTNDKILLVANDLIQIVSGKKTKAEKDRDDVVAKITIK